MGIAARSIDPHQLDAAAPEIGDNALGPAISGQHPGGRQPRLLGAFDDAHRNAASSFSLGGESASVTGLAHRRGGDDREVIDRRGARQR